MQRALTGFAAVFGSVRSSVLVMEISPIYRQDDLTQETTPLRVREPGAGNAMELLIIESGREERHYWRDLWRYRELFQVLAWRDLSVRYKQTAIGAIWALIRPFLAMLVFTIVFGRIA